MGFTPKRLKLNDNRSTFESFEEDYPPTDLHRLSQMEGRVRKNMFKFLRFGILAAPRTSIRGRYHTEVCNLRDLKEEHTSPRFEFFEFFDLFDLFEAK